MRSSTPNFDPTYVRAQIETLRIRNPEIWEDGDPALVNDSLEGETSLHSFLDRVIAHMQEAQAFADGLANLISDLKIRRDNRLARIDALRALIFKLMSVAAINRIELQRATLSIRNGTRKVIITDETSLPDQFVRIKREPDKQRIREYLENSNVGLAGAELSNAEPVLAVRVK